VLFFTLFEIREKTRSAGVICHAGVTYDAIRESGGFFADLVFALTPRSDRTGLFCV